MICTVGLICIDIVNLMPTYPDEDSDNRCAQQSWSRGGNAANSATVLSIVGAEVECLGTIADDAFLKFQQEDMSSYGIKHGNCPIIKGCGNGPLSIVVCSKKTGSRTIVHAKGNLPELKLEDFVKLNLSEYSWIHFEGRNEHELPLMMKHAKKYNDVNCKSINGPLETVKYKRATLPLSLEIELQIENLDIMLPLADVVIVGKDYAKHHGARNSKEAAEIIVRNASVEPGTVVVAPWGEEGASYCIISQNPEDVEIHKQNAYVPADEIVDSLGAGDTFIAIVIYCLYKGLEVGNAVDYACKIASKKLQIRGLKDLKNIIADVKLP